MAYNQRMFARQYQDPAVELEDKLEALLARVDSMLAWRETKGVCDIDSIPDCPLEPHPVDLVGAPASFPGPVHIYGKVAGDSVRELGPNRWAFKVVLEPPPAAPGQGGSGQAPPKDPGGGEGGAPAPIELEVEYTFVPPEVDEGEPTPDITEHVAETTATWKEGGSVILRGKIKSATAFEVVEEPIGGCCPPPPLTPVQEEAPSSAPR
jgi:hypothetical protein